MTKEQIMARFRAGSAVALAASMALVLAACTGNDEDPGDASTGEPTDSDEPVTITWWHNGTGEPLLGLWQAVADEFEELHPNVTVDVQAFQNEEMQRTLLPNALRSNDPPEVPGPRRTRAAATRSSFSDESTRANTASAISVSGTTASISTVGA